MIDPTSFSSPIRKGDAPVTLPKIMRKLTKAADRVLAPLLQKQVLFDDDPDPVLAGKTIKELIAENGGRVQQDTILTNDFNARLYAYLGALQTLAEPPITEGKPERQTTDIIGYAGPYGEDLIYRTIAATPGLSPTIEVPETDENGEPTGEIIEVDNPDVVADNAKRAAAQSVVDGVAQDVLDWIGEQE